MNLYNRRISAVTLKQLCLQQMSSTILSATPSQNKSISDTARIKRIPLELSQEIFECCAVEARAEDVNRALKFFLENSHHTPLRQICIQNTYQADVNLIRRLVKANLETLTNLDLSRCRTLPRKFWHLLQKAPNLTYLKTASLPLPLKCPKLDILVVDWKPRKLAQRIQCRLQGNYYDKLLQDVLPNLKYLDLSWCPWVGRLKTLGNARALEALILRGCDVSHLVDAISQLTQLRVLDISVGVEHEFDGNYLNPHHVLTTIVLSLQQLEYLDISGTNLIPSTERRENYDVFKTRSNSPFQFLGMYSNTCNEISQLDNLPALYTSGNNDSKALTEAIMRNIDMPKTLRNQISKLRSIHGSSVDTEMLLKTQIKMMKNLRANENCRLWTLKCVCSFLNSLVNIEDQISLDTRREIFITLNQLDYSQAKAEEVSELSLRYTFKIFLKVLSFDDMKDDGVCRELMCLGKFLVSLKRTNFVYFKTEALLFRLLYRLSLEANVCTYLSEYSVVPSCFEFFKTIQVYLGFSLRVSQTSEIVTITWKSLLNFMDASQYAIRDFFKQKGLSWIYAHISWFSYDERTRGDLRTTFMSILNILENYLVENKHNFTLPLSSQILMYKVKYSIQTLS